jgi:hypothetical protein
VVPRIQRPSEITVSLAYSESAARSRQAQQRRGRRCCGGSDDEAGLDGGWNSNSVPLSLCIGRHAGSIRIWTAEIWQGLCGLVHGGGYF